MSKDERAVPARSSLMRWTDAVLERVAHGARDADKLLFRMGSAAIELLTYRLLRTNGRSRHASVIKS
jgi:hypothetical protein